MIPETSPASAARPADFPGWLPPMLVKELRQGLRAKGFVALFLLFHVFAVIVFWWTIEINAASGLRDTFNWLNGVFWALLNFVLLLVMPWRGLGGLRTEIDNRTLDLLMLTRLTAWRVVLGKWVALGAQALLFLLALLPYGVVRYFFGSVDLAGDLVQAGWLLLISLVLVAASLWVSGLPKFFRILMPVILIIGAQSLGMATVFSRIMSGRTGAGPAGMMFGAFGWGQLLLLLLLLVVFLGLAVRRLAPAAENHAMGARLLGLCLLVAAALAAICLGRYVGRSGGPVAFIALILVAAVEISRDCLPMSSHWRPWARRGGIWKWFGRLMLPGWPSAALYAAFALALLAGAMAVFPAWRPSGTVGFAFVWWLVLAWQALVFPALLLSFLPANSSMRIGGTGYLVVQGLFGTISLLSATNSAGFIGGENFARSLDALCGVLPVFSFWLRADSLKTGFTTAEVIGQAASLGVLGLLIYSQSRIYWGTVARFDARIAAEPAAQP